jgi:hypothetical protein|tara:strand:+ start:540 stop:716 length:177 start_codon:yes stop_codon:yes gene_type:complete
MGKKRVEGPINLTDPIRTGTKDSGSSSIEQVIKSLNSGKSGYKSPGNSIKYEVKNPLK